ncbi:UNVERIFIED_CONTAM: hypothetical protein FKN15_004500 [Acipenser sinensis]
MPNDFTPPPMLECLVRCPHSSNSPEQLRTSEVREHPPIPQPNRLLLYTQQLESSCQHATALWRTKHSPAGVLSLTAVWPAGAAVV